MFYFILSAEKSNRPSMVNTANTESLRDSLANSGYPFTQIQGCYQGSTEVSFIVGCDNVKQVDKLKKLCLSLAASFDQDSIAALDANNRLSLIYSNGVMEYLGKMMQDNTAKDNYSIIQGKKYSAK